MFQLIVFAVFAIGLFHSPFGGMFDVFYTISPMDICLLSFSSSREQSCCSNTRNGVWMLFMGRSTYSNLASKGCYSISQTRLLYRWRSFSDKEHVCWFLRAHQQKIDDRSIPLFVKLMKGIFYNIIFLQVNLKFHHGHIKEVCRIHIKRHNRTMGDHNCEAHGK